MATERVTERNDGTRRERVVERDDDGEIYVDRGGAGLGGIIVGLVVLALVAIVAFFLLNQGRNAATNVGVAAGRTAEQAVAPQEPTPAPQQ